MQACDQLSRFCAKEREMVERKWAEFWAVCLGFVLEWWLEVNRSVHCITLELELVLLKISASPIHK